MNRKDIHLTLNNFTIIGIIAFICLYYYASTLYSGGSQHSLDSEGYDWIHNYWCNLFSINAMNGSSNPARPYAIVAMCILCFSITIFFIQYAIFKIKDVKSSIALKLGGIGAMFSATWLFTNFHDVITIVASGFGIIALYIIAADVSKSGNPLLKRLGVFGLILLIMNNFIYYSEFKLEWLPLIQKITFVVVLTWVVLMNYKLRYFILNEDQS